MATTREVGEQKTRMYGARDEKNEAEDWYRT